VRLDDFIFNRFDRPSSTTFTETPEMQRRAAIILVVITPALLVTSCKSSSKSKVTTQLKVSATAIAPATTAPAPSSSAPASPTPLPPLPPATSAPASPSASPTPTPTPTASAPASPSPSGSKTTLDPCQLVTQDEASTLAHATYGPGKEEVTEGGGKLCVYGSNTGNVLTVFVGQAVDAATAKAEWTAELTELEAKLNSGLPAGDHVSFDTSNTAGLGDEAAIVSGGEDAAGIKFDGVYVLSGPTFFLIGDLVLNRAPAAIADLKTQAQTILGRI
jgi:hypothetical protein